MSMRWLWWRKESVTVVSVVRWLLLGVWPSSNPPIKAEKEPEMSNDIVDLVAIAREINASEARIEALKARAVEEAVVQGNLLAKAKAALPHGQFTPWLQANCHVTPVQARKYMRLAAGVAGLPEPDRARLLHMGFEAAVKEVTQPKTKPKRKAPPRASQAAKTKVVTVDLSSASLEDIHAELERRLDGHIKLTVEQAAGTEHSYHKLTKKQQGLISRFARDYPEFVNTVQTAFYIVVEKEADRRAKEDTESIRANIAQRLKKAEELQSLVINMKAGVMPFMSLEEARMLTNCLHPDRAPEDRKEKYSRAFEVAKRLQDALARFASIGKK
jgi:hypothetical protein